MEMPSLFVFVVSQIKPESDDTHRECRDAVEKAVAVVDEDGRTQGYEGDKQRLGEFLGHQKRDSVNKQQADDSPKERPKPEHPR